ncbi:MAG: aspartate--ammonia ligase [Bacilli bacterium]|nr:aspartate--ammonia ligase [Bacilli bacterium]
MKNNIFVKGYHSPLDVVETQKAIKLIKGNFEKNIAKALGLSRVSAPLFVDPTTGLNDNLSGKEKAINFHLINGQELEIVQSLAKWKRYALKKYNLSGLYTDMNAIRPNEETDNLHSLYVDQWDWEKVIKAEDRNIDYLKATVRNIYKAFLKTEEYITELYPSIKHDLPNDITFFTTQELLDMYPNMNNKERENAITKKYKAVFIIGIGKELSNGKIHDDRAADYDDWDLNGDILVWHETLGIALEISSMGIRVNKDSLLKQIKHKHEEFKLEYDYHKQILNDELPLTIGGGIGQSRLCLFFLNKAHIGEVQSSYWDKEDIEEFKKYNINLL